MSTDCDSECAQECAKRIAKVSADAKLEVDEETYLNQFKPHLMDVVYAWTNGATFAQICKMTDVFEGWSLTGQEVKLHVVGNHFKSSLVYISLHTLPYNIKIKNLNHFVKD